MVKSLLKNNVNYSESKRLEEQDIDYETSLYQAKIDGLDTIVAIGQGKYDLTDSGVVYYPIYTVNDNVVKHQIGVYEALTEKANDLLDEDKIYKNMNGD